MLVKISSYVVFKYHAAYATLMHHTTGRISYYQKLSLTPHTQGVAPTTIHSYVSQKIKGAEPTARQLHSLRWHATLNFQGQQTWNPS